MHVLILWSTAPCWCDCRHGGVLPFMNRVDSRFRHILIDVSCKHGYGLFRLHKLRYVSASRLALQKQDMVASNTTASTESISGEFAACIEGLVLMGRVWFIVRMRRSSIRDCASWCRHKDICAKGAKKTCLIKCTGFPDRGGRYFYEIVHTMYEKWQTLLPSSLAPAGLAMIWIQCSQRPRLLGS